MTYSMSSFGKKLRECREAKDLSQSELAKLLNTNHSIIGKYERDEVKPTIDVVKKLADELETTVGFLLGETNQVNVLKDPAMLKRLNDIDALPEEDKKYILYAIDGLLRDAKTRAAYK
jgi:transcriptional regulator with XRE-family HTH domain